MQTNVDKIIAAATAVGSFALVGEEPPDEIASYPAFYQWGRDIEADKLSGGRKLFDMEFDYVCWIVVSPSSKTKFSELDTLRSSFLAELADQNAIVTGFRSRQAKWNIGGDECYVDSITLSMRDEITVS